MFKIKDKVIVVTGGEGLLGSKIVKSLRSEGAITYSADIFFQNSDEYSLNMDIISEASITECIQFVVKKHGKIDGWVNNAYPRTKDWGVKFEEILFDSWSQNINMHLNGYFLCSKLILEEMKKHKNGSLINMSSIYGLIGPDFSIYEGTEMTMPAAYSAIKGGLNTFSRYLASYYGAANLRINNISPGGIYDNQDVSFVENYSKKVPLKRMGNPDDIVPAVHYLLSDESKYITGHNLVIDGGWSII